MSEDARTFRFARALGHNGLSFAAADKGVIMTTSHPDQISLSSIRERLCQWFASPLGQSLLEHENAALERVLPNLFGYHLVQLGETCEADLMASSRIGHRVKFALTPQSALTPNRLICASSHLPLDANSVDVVLLPHVLEYEEEPHDLLRESERILIAEGHVVILGFNPISLWGLRHLLLAWRERPPWSGHFYRAARVKDWLALLGFEIVKYESLYHRPPFRSGRLLHKLKFLDKLGKHLFPWMGGVYMIVAKKRVFPVTPVKMQWRIRRGLIASGVTEPSGRVMHRKSDQRES